MINLNYEYRDNGYFEILPSEDDLMSELVEWQYKEYLKKHPEEVKTEESSDSQEFTWEEF